MRGTTPIPVPMSRTVPPGGERVEDRGRLDQVQAHRLRPDPLVAQEVAKGELVQDVAVELLELALRHRGLPWGDGVWSVGAGPGALQRRETGSDQAATRANSG
jgi:hypothetical protein